MQKSLRRSHTWGKLAEFLKQRLFGNFLLLAAVPFQLGFLHNGDVMYQNKDKCAYDKAPNFGTSEKIVWSHPNVIQTDGPNSDKQASEKPSEEKIIVVDENLQLMIILVMSMSKSLSLFPCILRHEAAGHGLTADGQSPTLAVLCIRY